MILTSHLKILSLCLSECKHRAQDPGIAIMANGIHLGQLASFFSQLALPLCCQITAGQGKHKNSFQCLLQMSHTYCYSSHKVEFLRVVIVNVLLPYGELSVQSSQPQCSLPVGFGSVKQSEGGQCLDPQINFNQLYSQDRCHLWTIETHLNSGKFSSPVGWRAVAFLPLLPLFGFSLSFDLISASPIAMWDNLPLH